MPPETDFAKMDDLALMDAEDSLHKLYEMRKAAGVDVSSTVSAHDLLTAEMRERSLFYEPLPPSADAVRKATLLPGKMNRQSNKDGDGDLDASNNIVDDPDNDGGVDQGSDSGNSEARGGTEQQQPKNRKSQKQPDGPIVKKGSNGSTSNSGPPVTGTSPTMDDGINQKGKTKKGKGGEKNRTQDKKGGKVRSGGDPKNPGDLGYITNKSIWVTDSFQYVMAKAQGFVPGHDFTPVINVCKTCRTHANDHGSADHDLVPVRNVCKTCGKGSEFHVSKALGVDGSIFKALPQLGDEDKKAMAEQGIAMPDGSLPIPNEAFLHAAIGLIGQHADPQSAMNHVIQRAQAMGMEYALPDSWGVQPAGQPGQPQVGPGANALGAGPAPQTSPLAGSPDQKPGAPLPGGMGGASAKPMTPGATPGAGAGPSAGGMGGLSGAKTPKPKKPGLMKRLRGGRRERPVDLSPDYPYFVTKAVDEDRYTLGPVYMPETLDAHDEWTSAEDLRKSMQDYVRNTGSDRTIYLQHSDKPAGEWVDIVCWPHEVHAQMVKSVNGVRKATPVTFPAGTAYMGVVWKRWAWQDVKDGKLTGFSMGGMARRVEGSPSR